MNERRHVINLSGPDGNAYMLFGITQTWMKQLGRDPEPVIEDMKSDDYGHLLQVMCKEVGSFLAFEDVPEQYVDAVAEAVDEFGKPIPYSEAEGWGD